MPYFVSCLPGCLLGGLFTLPMKEKGDDELKHSVESVVCLLRVIVFGF